MQRVREARSRSPGVNSAALETYWSGGAILWGTAGPVRYLLRPSAGAEGAHRAARRNCRIAGLQDCRKWKAEGRNAADTPRSSMARPMRSSRVWTKRRKI